MNLSNKSPLRYPGGKTRACKKLDAILNEYFNINEIYTIISPFLGGGAFEFPNFLGRGQNFSISYQRGVNSNTSFGQSNFPMTSQNSSVSYQSMSVSFMDPRIFDTRNLLFNYL